MFAMRGKIDIERTVKAEMRYVAFMLEVVRNSLCDVLYNIEAIDMPLV